MKDKKQLQQEAACLMEI